MSAIDAKSSVATILVRVLGTARLAVAGVVLGVGAFLLLALSQASHFAWGFQFLDAAVIFAVIAPVVVFVDTVVLAVRSFRRWRTTEQHEPAATELRWIYMVLMWVAVASYGAVVF